MDEDKYYLGDGAFVSVTGMGFVLTTSDGVVTTNEIIIDLEAYLFLRRFCDAVLKEIKAEAYEGE